MTVSATWVRFLEVMCVAKGAAFWVERMKGKLWDGMKGFLIGEGPLSKGKEHIAGQDGDRPHVKRLRWSHETPRSPACMKGFRDLGIVGTAATKERSTQRITLEK